MCDCVELNTELLKKIIKKSKKKKKNPADICKRRDMHSDNCTLDIDCVVEKRSLSFLESQPSHAIPYIGFTVLALTVGISGNLIIVGCFLISKKLSKVGNEFLFNMALSDLCVTGLAEPMCILGKFNLLL